MSRNLHDEASEKFSLDSTVFARLSFPDLHDLSWRSTSGEPFTLRTDDGRSIVTSKNDLEKMSEYFKCMFSNDAYLEAGADKMDLRETSGSDLEVLLSIYYLREKVPITPSE